MKNPAAWFRLVIGSAGFSDGEAAKRAAARLLSDFVVLVRDLSGKFWRAAESILIRIRSKPCIECSGLVRLWNRRVRLDGDRRRAHLSCWRQRLLFEELSRTMPSRTAVAPRRRSARMREDVRAMASELRVAVLRLERSIYETDHHTVLCDAQEVLSLARTVSAYLRAGAGDDRGWMYSQPGRSLKQHTSRASADDDQAGARR